MHRNVTIKGKQITFNHDIKWYEIPRRMRIEFQFISQIVKAALF